MWLIWGFEKIKLVKIYNSELERLAWGLNNRESDPNFIESDFGLLNKTQLFRILCVQRVFHRNNFKGF